MKSYYLNRYLIKFQWKHYHTVVSVRNGHCLAVVIETACYPIILTLFINLALNISYRKAVKRQGSKNIPALYIEPVYYVTLLYP